jgi:hypothetical protein
MNKMDCRTKEVVVDHSHLHQNLPAVTEEAHRNRIKTADSPTKNTTEDL